MRDLEVLSIDDRSLLGPAGRPSSLRGELHQPPSRVRVRRYRAADAERYAIMGWEAAIDYWSSDDPDQRHLVDLAVADVRFDEDDTTPLNYTALPGVGPSRDVPTGLSHVKAFAACARITGSPIGVGLHTANQNMAIWSDLIAEGGPNARMGLLAAHEIGELAAILDGNVKLPPSIEERLRWCWDWLRDRTARQFFDGVCVALRDYRRRLVRLSNVGRGGPPQIVVLPRDWASLQAWCTEMARKPVPLAESDPGVRFVLPDGRKDHVALASLFADVSPDVCDFEFEALEPKCFTVPEVVESHDEPPWLLDARGRPKLADFLYALGSASRAYDEAVRTLNTHFPVHLDDDTSVSATLFAVVPHSKHGSSDLVRALAIMLQVVQRQHENWKRWRNALEWYEWDARNLSFTSLTNESPQSTLLFYLRTLFRVFGEALEEHQVEGLSAREFADAIAQDLTGEAAVVLMGRSAEGRLGASLGHRQIEWHLRRLVELGVLAADRGDGEFRRTGRSRLRISDPPPQRITGFDEVVPWEAMRPFLRNSLGFGGPPHSQGTVNDHAIDRALQKGFGLDSKQRAMEFLAEFAEGDAPTWLVELCRQFARGQLQWQDEETWPKSLRARGR